jgi:hypothetical protein
MAGDLAAVSDSDTLLDFAAERLRNCNMPTKTEKL